MIAVILKGWPRLSETFIARELEALEARGLKLDLWSLRAPTDTARHAVHDRVRAAVTYLPEYLHREPGRVYRAWRKLRWAPGYAKARALFGADWRRDRSRNRIRRFGQALVLAAEMKPGTRGFYAHFAHTPGSVARYAAALTGLPFALSAHARDIWTTPDWDLREKLTSARFTTCCTADGAARLEALGGAPQLNRHGLDLSAWPLLPEPRAEAGPVRLLSVGRLVEKKGYDVLLAALARLDPRLDWRLKHIGGGPLREAMAAQAAALGLSARIDWQGPQPEETVRAAMRATDIFVLTPKIAADRDRDGLPNVLVEAQSQGLPVVATRVGGVGELVSDGETGLLAPPENAALIAAALSKLIASPELRARLGGAGRRRVETGFQAAPGADAIAAMLREAFG